MPLAHTTEVIELSSSSDDTSSCGMTSDTDYHAAPFDHIARGRGIRPLKSRKYRNRSKPTKTQRDIATEDSEAEVDSLICVEYQASSDAGTDSGTIRPRGRKAVFDNNLSAKGSFRRSLSIISNGSDSGLIRYVVYPGLGELSKITRVTPSVTRISTSEVHAPQPTTSGAYISNLSTPYNNVPASPASTYSFHWMEPPELHTPEPGDWTGPKHGEIVYINIPMDLLFLLTEGGRWSFTRTAPTSKCHNRAVGDIHFTPGEMSGYDYWVCCRVDESQSGRGWVPWRLGKSHPLYPDLALYHFYDGATPLWALKLELLHAS
ncbi:hypothetical protein FRC12_013882 [Ceratobasidium sp. 428]|nr:hypothetical protein FRC12_013882 [Ceratobasidium sp. 428]